MCIPYRLLNLRARLVETLLFKVRPTWVIAGSLVGFDTQVQSAERAHGDHTAGSARPRKMSAFPADSSEALESPCLRVYSLAPQSVSCATSNMCIDVSEP